jgi:tellurite resistance protein
MEPERLRAQGERELAEALRAEPVVKEAIDKAAEAEPSGARRQLLATALRLDAEIAPDISRLIDEAAEALSLDVPIEPYVYPGAQFNAAAVRPEAGRTFVIFSSSLLEAFDESELRFVVGHELGHHVFDHHSIPTQILLHPKSRIRPALALQIFAWQRYAEVSCDRTGLIAAGDLHHAASALFKLASGLGSTERVRIRVDRFLSQLGDLQSEAQRLDRADSPVRSDWFATHPFSPLRLRAAELFARSELVVDGGTPAAELETEVHELMTLMDPSYLQAKTDVAEAMRRLVFAGGILIAAASGEISTPELEALEQLLGPGSLPSDIKPDAIRAALPRRIARVVEKVPRLRRMQIIRDLCLIARADGQVIDAEHKVLAEIARGIEVDGAQIDDFIGEQAGRPLD